MFLKVTIQLFNIFKYASYVTVLLSDIARPTQFELMELSPYIMYSMNTMIVKLHTQLNIILKNNRI